MKDIKQADICIIVPPATYAILPSMAAGLLKSCLTNEGISCYVDYAGMRFIKAMGYNNFQRLFGTYWYSGLGEYIFNEEAGIKNSYSRKEYVEFMCGRDINPEKIMETDAFVEFCCTHAKQSVVETVERILARKPKAVGCSSIFHQRNASLAILKAIKEQQPDIVTFMGGFNCKEEAGIAMLKEFPFVDYVFFGESDDIFADVCRKMISCSETDPEELPYGVLKNGGPYPDEPPYRAVMDFEHVPIPDYDEYFELLESCSEECVYASGGVPKILIESSRGCWWGEKHQCTFCGLNNRITEFRKKPYDRVLNEMDELSERYGIKYFDFADNIMPADAFEYFIPRLIEENKGYNITAEVKSNLTRLQVKQLAKAGYSMVQPGIESLSDNVLKLMSKGVSAIQNIACLKYGREYGVGMVWNILTGFPGETLGDIYSQTQIIPLIEHFDICFKVMDIVYERNNVYCSNPEKYGLKLEPADFFRYCSPDNPEYIKGIAYQYKNINAEQNWMMDIQKSTLIKEVASWADRKKEYGDSIRFDFYHENDGIAVTDTRECAVNRNYLITGIQKDLCLLAIEPISDRRIREILIEKYDSIEIDHGIESAKADKMILELNGKYLFLATETTKENADRLDSRMMPIKKVNRMALI